MVDPREIGRSHPDPRGRERLELGTAGSGLRAIAQHPAERGQALPAALLEAPPTEIDRARKTMAGAAQGLRRTIPIRGEPPRAPTHSQVTLAPYRCDPVDLVSAR